MSTLECSAQVQGRMDRHAPLDRAFRRCLRSLSAAPAMLPPEVRSSSPPPLRRQRGCRKMTTNRMTSADFVTAFATGWPEKEPHLLVLSLTTHKGVQDFAVTKEQALL